MLSIIAGEPKTFRVVVRRHQNKDGKEAWDDIGGKSDMVAPEKVKDEKEIYEKG